MEGFLQPDALEVRYADIKRESKRIGERNDCSVVAIAMIYDMSYIECHALLMKLGRKVCRGFDTDVAIRHLDRVYNKTAQPKIRPKQSNGSKYTVKTIANTIPVGRYLVHTDGHILACIDGVIYDWTEDRKHRVIDYQQVGSILESL